MRVAVLGMGRMGQAAALRLLDRGHEVAVWNRSPGRTDEVVAHGAAAAASVVDAVRGADVVMTSLANDEAVRAVALGQDGLAAHVGDALTLEASTISPALSAELAGQFDHHLATPVVGAPTALLEGRAVLLVGGAEEDAQRGRPVLDALASAVRRYPRAELANVAKLATNMLLLSGVVALAESVAVGRAGGLSDDQLAELLSESPMLAPGLGNRFQAVLTGTGEAWWSLDLGAKDARLALELAPGDLPLLERVRARYEEAARAEAPGSDIAAVARLYRH